MKGLYGFVDSFARALSAQKSILINSKEGTVAYDKYISEEFRAALPLEVSQALWNKEIGSVEVKLTSTVESCLPYGTIKFLLVYALRALALGGIRESSIPYSFSSTNSDAGGADYTINGVAQITQAKEVSHAVVINITISESD